MLKRKAWLAVVFAALCQQPVLSHAAEVKVGVLGQFSGPYSWWGTEYQRGIDLYLDQTKGKVGDDTISVVERDETGINPQRTRQLAQELVVRDGVQYLFGTSFTPNALAITDIANQTKTPFLIGNSGTSMVTSKSPYFIRMGFTQWTVSVPLVQYAVSKGVKNAVTVVADFATGYDAIDAYTDAMNKAGGKIVGDVRVPLGTTDFSSYLQRVRDAKPQAVFMFMPVGPMSAGFIKAFKNAGLDKAGITLYATTETMESDLPAIGDSAIPNTFVDITHVWDKKLAAIECMAGQEHLWEYYTRVALQRGVQAKRNIGITAARDIKYAEGLMRLTPTVAEQLG